MPPTTELISKIQYNTFEPGEFIDEQKRTYEEIVSKVENFPWEQQREKIHISLTCPSVTMQAGDTSYLKLTVYYNNKFILYFYNGRNLYSKSLIRYQQAFEDIGEYFNTGTINIPDFKKESTFFKPPQIHFITRNFIYRVDNEKPFRYISPFTILGILFYAGTLIFLITQLKLIPGLTFITIFLLIVGFFVFGPVNLILALNYLDFCRNKMLQLSKGATEFMYGNIDSPEIFKKSDIERIIVKRNARKECLWANYTISVLYMKDGNILTIPSTLLGADEIGAKMPNSVMRTEQVFIPYINKSE